MTIHNKRIRSYDTGWWRRDVVTMGSGEEGKWWGREVVTKGSGEEGKWWWRGVVTKGSGEEGKWWRRKVVTKGSGEEGKWWWRGVVTKGSGEEGKWWRREVVTKGSGEEGKWWRREVMMLHRLCVGEEAGARNLVFFRVKWLQPAMKGTSSVRRLRLRSFGSFYVFCNNGCSCVRSSMRFLKRWLRIALEWVHECCMLLSCGEEAGAQKPCVLPYKVAAGDDERYLVCAAGAAGVVSCANWFLLCVLQRVVVSVCVVSMRFLNLWLWIALEWLHECCMGYLVGRKPEHETVCFSV